MIPYENEVKYQHSLFLKDIDLIFSIEQKKIDA